MKLLVLNYEYPPLGGGAGIISKNIAEGLAALGNEVTVLTTYYEGTEEDCIENGVHVIRLKSRRKDVFQSNVREMLSWMICAKRFLKNHLQVGKYDLCFANFALPCGEVAYSMKDMFHLPYTIISHGHDIPWFFPEQMMWYHAACYQWIRKICMQSKRNYVQSDEMLSNINAFLGGTDAKNKLIFNGWNRDKFFPDESKRAKKFTILFAGRLVLQKDPMTFLKAINIAKSEIKDFDVHIVGDGKMRKKMEDFVKKNGLEGIVVFKNWLTKPEIIAEYQSASLTVMPSLAEGMSMALLEALACGQYVIATKVSNNEKLITAGINGDFIEKKDYKTLADKIIDFHKNKFQNNYTVPAEHFDSLAEQFDWKNIVKQYDEDLKGILDLRF
ncbi:MAG: glycosyltransferase family 4 protein [Bacteroidales bacterium]|nr:glycosyltransferase family 4 protein [Bacteroidales bacterium]